MLDRPGVREAAHKLLFDESISGVAFVTPDGVFVAVNPAFCYLTGYTATELIARRSWQDITVWDDVADEAAERAKVATGEVGHTLIRKKYRHKAGWDVPVTLTVHSVAETGGGIAILVSQARQEEPRRRTEDDDDGGMRRRLTLDDIRLEDLVRSFPNLRKWAYGVVATVGLGGAGQLGLSYLNHSGIREAGEQSVQAKAAADRDKKIDELLARQKR